MLVGFLKVANSVQHGRGNGSQGGLREMCFREQVFLV